MTKLWDGLLMPVQHSPRLALVLTALLLGMLTAMLMRYLTPRQWLAWISAQSKAELLAIRLFADQRLNLAGSLWRLLWLSVARIACFMPACLLLLPLGVLISAQLEMRFAREPLLPGETALVTLQWAEHATADRNEVQLTCDAPLRIARGPLRAESTGTIYWSIQSFGTNSRLSVQAAHLTFQFPSDSFRLPVSLASSTDPLRAIPNHWSNRLSDRLGLALPGSWPTNLPVQQVTVHYPVRRLAFAGIQLPWEIAFLLLFCLGYALASKIIPSSA